MRWKLPAAVGAVILLLVVVGSLTTGDRAAPPEIVLLVDGESVTGVEGTYCWDRICVDKIGPAELVADQAAIVVPQDASYAFAVRHGPAPEAVYHSVYWLNNTVIRQGDAAGGFSVPLDPGTYVVAGQVMFDQGDVSSVFKIKITDNK